MDLAFRDLGGNGPPIVILHGLFGSSQNWASLGRRLAARGRCFALDLRNHGDSPHAPTHSLADCVEDLRIWIERRLDEPPRLVGHSMGGLAAMGFAIAHPRMTAGLAVIDIAPRAYPLDHERELQALRTDISACRTRGELDVLLAPILPDPLVRQFLLTNAVRTPGDTGSASEGFRWRLNTTALESSSISGDFSGVTGRFEGPALFVAGGSSDYLREADHAAVLRYFPRARIECIPGADHWPHVSAPRELEAILDAFLAAPSNAVQ
jgi:pimeloyl-ACP methyl ester carboxylesterase